MPYTGDQYRVIFYYRDGSWQDVYVVAKRKSEAGYLASLHINDQDYISVGVAKQ